MKQQLLISILLLFSAVYSFAQKELEFNNDRILVISGGGAKGAWGAGLAKRLSEDNKLYHHIIGTSTGALIAPYAILNKFDSLRYAYTSITSKDVFNRYPFREEKGHVKIRNINAIKSINRESIGDSYKLKKLISKFYLKNHYDKLKETNSSITVCVVNFRTGKTEYKSSKNYSHPDMINWIWASSNEPIFMNPYIDDVNKNRYYDGGLVDNVPLKYAIDSFAMIDSNVKYIDVIVHNPQQGMLDTSWGMDPLDKTEISYNVKLLQTLLRTIEILRTDVRINDLDEVNKNYNKTGFLQNDNDNIKVTIYYMPDFLIEKYQHDLRFEKALMMEAFDRGYQKKYVGIDSFLIPRGRVKEIVQNEEYAYECLLNEDKGQAQMCILEVTKLKSNYKKFNEVSQILEKTDDWNIIYETILKKNGNEMSEKNQQKFKTKLTEINK
jgi:NTE family protein